LRKWAANIGKEAETAYKMTLPCARKLNALANS
jgi:hypothetical protein